MPSVPKALLLIEQEARDCVEHCIHQREGGEDEGQSGRRDLCGR